MNYNNTSSRLTCAVREGNLERARELITSFGLSYSEAWLGGYALLCDAIRKKHTQVIKLLLTNGSKVNGNTDKFDNTPLHFAVLNGDIEIVKMLLDRRANVNATTWQGTTPLHYAIENKKIEIAELLLNHGANVNASTKNGITFHSAAEKRYLQIDEHLVNHGIYINSTYIYSFTPGNTPLFLAVKRGHVDAVKMLMDRGSNVNAETWNGTTLLHYAIVTNEIKIAELLLNHGVNVNASTTSGNTPLYFAVKNRHVKGVTMLLDRDANINSILCRDYFDLYCGINSCVPVAEILTQHIVKMKTANFYISRSRLWECTIRRFWSDKFIYMSFRDMRIHRLITQIIVC
ncbi:uncharacterized protein LOC109861755 isoform X3 [Pseudomyrmex gracilis]|uniref:uncharacterized protein LOC109861755 isoform X3 n=1 Tax=Pseudomyrmex gracilis TaxID=219809 RepID=UPI000994C05E|nr:uncharacterized protein LOC109861755 isoform X3 [Pseudomyrmex gracilis]